MKCFTTEGTVTQQGDQNRERKKKTSSALLTLGKCTLQSADSVPRGAQSKLTDGLDLGPGCWTGLRGRS